MAICLDHIQKRYVVYKKKGFLRRERTVVTALKDLSFSIEKGEVVGYIGPNGAGKSTTIKIMSGILAPDGGRCEVDGIEPYKDRVAHVKRIGVVFGQRSALWWDVPVIDSYELLRDIYKIPREVYEKSLGSVTELLKLGDLLRTPVRQLSLGQRMRCEIAAALLHEPSILFLDEPTIGLDAVSKLAVRDFIHAVNRERGVTVLLTTHDMNDIEALASRVMLLGKGELLYDGTLTAIKEKHARTKTLTARFRGGAAPIINGAESLPSQEEGLAIYRFDSEALPVPAVIERLAGTVDLRDISVTEPPLEEIMASLYRELKL